MLEHTKAGDGARLAMLARRGEEARLDGDQDEGRVFPIEASPA
jgi:hypothetical protein